MPEKNVYNGTGFKKLRTFQPTVVHYQIVQLSAGKTFY